MTCAFSGLGLQNSGNPKRTSRNCAGPGSAIGAGCITVFAPYSLKNVRIDGFDVVLNKPRSSAYRAPGATEWDKTKTLDWAMDRIAELTKKTRDETFREFWTDKDGNKKRVNHTMAIASLGGATMDNEWNYVQCKLMRGLGVVFLENQARI